MNIQFAHSIVKIAIDRIGEEDSANPCVCKIKIENFLKCNEIKLSVTTDFWFYDLDIELIFKYFVVVNIGI